MSAPPAPIPAAPEPPVAARRPVETTLHGRTRVDDYAWLRDRDDPAVLAHLRAENEHTAAVMAPTEALQERLFQEIKSRVLETDLSVPTRKGPWEYYSRTIEGAQYSVHCRRPAGLPAEEAAAAEQVLLDENALADGHDYFELGTFELSPDHRLLAYATDTAGDEVYDLRVRDLSTGADRPDVVPGTAPGVAWSADSATLFYTVLDDAMRPWQLWRHAVGTDPGDDVLVLQEDDDRFYVSVGLSSTEELVVVTIGSRVTTEVHLIPAGDPTAAPRPVEPRRQDVEYAVDHHRSADGSQRLFVLTNDGAEDFRLAVAPVDSPGRDHWAPLVIEDAVADAPDAGAPGVTKLDGIDAFRRHLVLYERHDGTERIRVAPLHDDGTVGAARVLPQAEPVHTVWGTGNAEFDTHVLRFGYASPVTPPSVYDEDLDTGERVLRKRQPVLGDFDPSRYVVERQWAVAPDGARVPISLVRHRDTSVDGTAPGVLYGYGAYEISTDPAFSVARLSLLDRGFVFAIAHVRGGGELGRRWYLDGKLARKQHSFSDFVACAEHLLAEGVVAPGRLAARGGSAGGLLVGAVLNQRPDLFAAVVAEVPFVDVVTTMLDDSLPLTAIEWEEWGNPAEPEAFATIAAYSPYDNVRPCRLPAVLVTAGLNDPRVGFWEPAKWVAKLRTAALPGSGPVLLKTELGAGHGGPSGRYDAWRDEAFVLAFLLNALSPGARPL